MSANDNWINIKEASDISGYTSAHVSRWAQKGRFNAKKDGRNWLIDYPSFKSFLHSNKEESEFRKTALKVKRKIEFKESPIVHVRLLNIEASIASLAVILLSYLISVITYQSINNGFNISDVRYATAYIAENISNSMSLEQAASLGGLFSR